MTVITNKEPSTEGVDFSIVRNLLNTYNQKHLKEFTDSPEHCFWALSYLKNIAKVGSDQQKHVDPEKLLSSIDYLIEAISAKSSSFNTNQV